MMQIRDMRGNIRGTVRTFCSLHAVALTALAATGAGAEALSLIHI